MAFVVIVRSHSYQASMSQCLENLGHFLCHLCVTSSLRDLPIHLLSLVEESGWDIKRSSSRIEEHFSKNKLPTLSLKWCSISSCGCLQI